MSDRRADDQVNDAGEPTSAAHKVIYDKIGELKQDLVRHTKVQHHEDASVAQLVEDFAQLADKTLGTRKTELEGGGRNDDGWDHKIEDLYAKLGNGQRLSIGLDWKDRVAAIVAIAVMVAKLFGLF